jgi:hypothetical protein
MTITRNVRSLSFARQATKLSVLDLEDKQQRGLERTDNDGKVE